VFRRFVERVLLPILRRGGTVVWDNWSAHNGAAVAGALVAAGITQYDLPLYSPEYNPMEQAWSKSKTRLRDTGARPHRRLRRALKQALSQITKRDAAAWFTHCGYSLH
jgi:transposase